MKKINKLIRDKIPEIIVQNWEKFKLKNVFWDELKEYVLKKIQEELDELIESEDIWEVADLMEILRKFCEIKWYSLDEVERIRQNKKEERGSFEKWIILLEVGDYNE